jgi:hypothetical protein
VACYDAAGSCRQGLLLHAGDARVADWAQSGQISFDHWSTWLLVAAGPLLSMGYDYMSKNFPLFGPALDAVAATPNVPPIVAEAVAEAKAPRKIVAKKATKSTK